MTTSARLKIRFAALLVVAASARPVLAQERPDSAGPESALPLDALQVQVTRAAATVGGTSALRIELDSLRLAPAPTLDAALRQVPFVLVRQNSRGETELAMRGSESRHVAVLLDGVPLTLGWDARTDPAIIPLTGAEGITLARGLSSVLHGPNVLGGVVEVGMARGASRTPSSASFSLSGGMDAEGGHSFGALATTPFELSAGDLTVRAGAGYRQRDGIALPGDVADPLATPDGLRGNTDARSVDGFLAMRYRGLGGSWLSLTTTGYRGERGVPPELHVSQPRYWRYPLASRVLVALSGGTGLRATRWGEGDIEASVGVDLGRTEIDAFTDGTFSTLDSEEDGTDRTLSFRLLGGHTLGRRTMLRAAVTYADTRHDETLTPGGEFGYRQRLWSVAGEVERALRADARGAWLSDLRIAAGLALDGADTPESGDKPPLGSLATWGGRIGVSGVAADGAVLLHAGVSRRARFPALRELYSGALGRFEPNPDLKPEALTAGEAGVTWQRGVLHGQAIAFHHRLTDAIVRISTPERRFKRVNRDEIRSTGIELLGGVNWRGWGLSGETMIQRVRVHDPDAGSSHRPEHQPEFSAALDLVAPLPMGVRGGATLRYKGTQYCVHPDLGDDVELEGTPRFDVELARSWSVGRRGTRVELLGALDNVGDAAVYDQCGMPESGRVLRMQVRLY